VYLLQAVRRGLDSQARRISAKNDHGITIIMIDERLSYKPAQNTGNHEKLIINNNIVLRLLLSVDL
jgi:hypothetical protein